MAWVRMMSVEMRCRSIQLSRRPMPWPLPGPIREDRSGSTARTKKDIRFVENDERAAAAHEPVAHHPYMSVSVEDSQPMGLNQRLKALGSGLTHCFGCWHGGEETDTLPGSTNICCCLHTSHTHCTYWHKLAYLHAPYRSAALRARHCAPGAARARVWLTPHKRLPAHHNNAPPFCLRTMRRACAPREPVRNARVSVLTRLPPGALAAALQPLLLRCLPLCRPACAHLCRCLPAFTFYHLTICALFHIYYNLLCAYSHCR